MAETTSHQALYYAVSRADVIETILARLRETGVVTCLRAEAWGIENSRAVATEAYRTDTAGRLRHLVLIASTVTVEAQNALLKILEEPPRGVVFHCIFPPGSALLPTVRSRLIAVPLPPEAADTELFDALIRLPVTEQLSLIEERLKQKDLVWVEAIKRGGFERIRGWLGALQPATASRLYTTLSLLNTRGAANKMLLEDVVLTVVTHVKNR